MPSMISTATSAPVAPTSGRAVAKTGAKATITAACASA